MKRSLSYAIFATCTAMSLVQAAPFQDSGLDLSGSIFLDAQTPFQPSDLPNNILVSRARIDLKGKWSPTWSYKIRLERPSPGYNSDQLNALMPLAVVTWKAYDNMQFNFGLDTPRYSQAGTAAQSYIERDLGVLSDSIGKKLGVNVSGLIQDRYGYSLGVWSATARRSIVDYSYSVIPIEEDYGDQSFDPAEVLGVTGGNTSPTVSMSPEATLRFAIGGRVNMVLINNQNFSWGVGSGLQSLDVIVPAIAQVNDNGTYYYSTFEKRLAVTTDQSIAWRRLSLNVAGHYFKYRRNNDPAVSSAKNIIPSDVYVFQKKNHAISGYVELTALLVGEGYRIDPNTAVANRITPNAKYGSLEIALRVGREYYYNMAAAQFLNSSFNGTNGLPMTFSRADGYNYVSIDPASQSDIIVRVKGYTVSTSYMPNDNIAFKAEYYDTKTSVKSNTLWTTLEKEEGIRLRTEFSFS